MTRSWDLPYPSRRHPVLADNVVATSQPLAVQAGIAMLQRGGNAVDAAIAAAAALTVVEPTSNGIGSDAFAIVAGADGIVGLNASGRSPAGLDSERLLGTSAMPLRGWDTVTVPGAVSAWVALWRRYGRLPFAELLGPAIGYARDGWLVGPVTAAAWARAPQAYAAFPEFGDAFLPDGRAPAAGERFALPDQATTLERIAASEGADLYSGQLAERIAAHARATGGALDVEDLGSHAAEWVDTISLAHRDVVLHELPPNGQGVAALIALGIAQRVGVSDVAPDSADWLHLQAEAMKLAFAEAHAHVADPGAMTTRVTDLLSPGRLDALAARVEPEQARDPRQGPPPPGGTVYLCAADSDGLLVSFIQSNYYGFGSGVVVPGTGISLQNRGAGFSTQPDHPNAVAPRKRPFHTIIPALVERDGGPSIAYGVMGGPMQPQGHLQVLLRLVDGELNPQAALDAPRWRVDEGRTLALEPGFAHEIHDDLARRGHELDDPATAPMGGFGGAQLIERLPSGWLAASDPRKEGHAAGC